MIKKYIIALLPMVVTSCQTPQSTTKNIVPTPLHVAYKTRPAPNGDLICFGGYGSAMAYDESDSTFYILTDRGPNVDGQTPESKMFPFPEYSPTIGHFKADGDSLVLIKDIKLREADGKPFLGLPNRKGDGVTGEVAYNLDGQIIDSEFRGLDSEGLALSNDGTFWISDEYAPFVLQFDRQGVLLREFNPSNVLPSHYAQRRPNRGMEGLTISNDGSKLYGIMQSPLYLPDQRTKNKSKNNRILEINLQDSTTREFIYPLENSELITSDIHFVNDSTMLVIERDEEFAVDINGIKKIYKINISKATDVSEIEMEILSPMQLDSAGIRTVEKELYVDVLKAVPGYSHDKLEGLCMINDTILAIVNDDDFSVVETPEGGFEPKIKANGEVDHAMVYFIKVAAE